MVFYVLCLLSRQIGFEYFFRLLLLHFKVQKVAVLIPGHLDILIHYLCPDPLVEHLTRLFEKWICQAGVLLNNFPFQSRLKFVFER